MNREVFLSISEASFSLGKKKLLKQISLTIHQKDKIALVGKNGVGKTTLLNILGGGKIIDEGELWVAPNLTMGILNQRNDQSSEFDVIKYLKSKNKDKNIIFKIERILKEIKLDKNKIVDNLSGGEKRKLALANLIILNPDLLLLDEPTNHLDIESIIWLQNYLNKEFKGSFLVISHNRNFLENITNKVFWMDRGLIKTSSKGFNNFESWKNLLIEQERRELKNKKQYLDDELLWLNRGVKARRKRNIKRKENVELLKTSYEQDSREFLRSITRVRINPEAAYNDAGPNIMINFQNVSKSFIANQEEKLILKRFSFKLNRGEKIGILGPNGSGKSTFLNLSSGKIIPNEGTVKIKKKITFSFFDQSGEQFDDKKTIRQNLVSSGADYIDVADKKIHICGYLKNFLFDPKEVDRVISSLSGGERNRLLLAKILASPKEVLILDEPTNDLDIETIDILIDFINLHKGSALISSHDIDFLKKTCQKFFIFDGSGSIKISLEPKFNHSAENQIIHSIHSKKKDKPISIDKLINRLLKKIEIKEKEIDSLTIKLQEQSKHDQKNKDFQNLVDDLKKAQIELQSLEKEWIDIEERSIGNE